jgi:2-polyprenyl-6-methoxyphenol hydroxylase-like FAD-dependent oxidoreductase
VDVAILGCGTAGSAAAIFLARQGHDVTVYERVPDPGPVGAGITLQPTGMHVLARLGLFEEVARRGARIDRLLCETVGGRALADLSYDVVSDRFYGLGMHRGVLFQSLFEEVKRCPRVTMKMGVTAEDLRPASPRGFQWVEDDQGERHGPHELVVVCDGARSHLRDDTYIQKKVAPYPWGALWFVGKDPDRTCGNLLYQSVRRNQRMLGLLPTGLGPDAANATPLVSLFFSIRADLVPAWRERGLAAWMEECLAMTPKCASVLDQIDDIDQILFAAYHDVEMYPWNTHNVVYLGDAAHAMSPQLGQGANLALYDAMVLADALGETSYLPLALARYARTSVSTSSRRGG